MIRKSAFLVAALIGLAAGPVAAETFDRQARTGQRTPVLNFALYNTDTCYAGPLPEARIVTQPAHGRIEFRAEQTRVAGQCGTLVALSQQVYYTSRGGYRGSDELVVEFEFNPTVEAPRKTSRRFTIRVEVR
ncbi:MAG: hypothetical protein O9322_04690 [Beijerinckiaceae bacterium]|nr:hypothetical protein [Beijerinckiaceae bacterium]MCZ8298817.1 hypothetical protein [Beijerinckiaceae bacterium]